jgi:hypothetical protein
VRTAGDDPLKAHDKARAIELLGHCRATAACWLLIREIESPRMNVGGTDVLFQYYVAPEAPVEIGEPAIMMILHAGMRDQIPETRMGFRYGKALSAVSFAAGGLRFAVGERSSGGFPSMGVVAALGEASSRLSARGLTQQPPMAVGDWPAGAVSSTLVWPARPGCGQTPLAQVPPETA